MKIDKYVDVLETMIVSLTIAFFNDFFSEILEVLFLKKNIREITVLGIYIIIYIFTEFYRKKNKNIVEYYYKLLIFQVSGSILLYFFSYSELLLFKKESFITFIILFIISELRFKVSYKFLKNFNLEKNALYLLYFCLMIFVIRVIFFLVINTELIFNQRYDIIESFKLLKR